MKNISENIRAIGREHSVKWKDGDNIVETWTESRTINVVKLREEVSDLVEQIQGMAYDMSVPTIKRDLENTLIEKQALLDSI